MVDDETFESLKSSCEDLFEIVDILQKENTFLTETIEKQNIDRLPHSKQMHGRAEPKSWTAPEEISRMVEEMGMTNEQYRGMLLDELEDWEEVLTLAKVSNNKKIMAKAQKQIEKINRKLEC